MGCCWVSAIVRHGESAGSFRLAGLGWLGLVNAERNAMSDIIFYAVLGFAYLALVDYVGCVGRR